MVSNIFYFHPYLGKISNLTNIFQMGWNHQPVAFILLMYLRNPVPVEVGSSSHYLLGVFFTSVQDFSQQYHPRTIEYHTFLLVYFSKFTLPSIATALHLLVVYLPTFVCWQSTIHGSVKIPFVPWILLEWEEKSKLNEYNRNHFLNRRHLHSSNLT